MFEEIGIWVHSATIKTAVRGAGFSVEAKHPKFITWAKRGAWRKSVAKSLPDQKKGL